MASRNQIRDEIRTATTKRDSMFLCNIHFSKRMETIKTTESMKLELGEPLNSCMPTRGFVFPCSPIGILLFNFLWISLPPISFLFCHLRTISFLPFSTPAEQLLVFVTIFLVSHVSGMFRSGMSVKILPFPFFSFGSICRVFHTPMVVFHSELSSLFDIFLIPRCFPGHEWSIP